MSGMPRPERLRRQAFDEGDSDDIVEYGVKDVEYGGSWPTGRCYHHEGCYQLKQCAATTTTTRKKAQERWLAPCPECVTDGIP